MMLRILRYTERLILRREFVKLEKFVVLKQVRSGLEVEKHLTQSESFVHRHFTPDGLEG